MSLMQVVQPIKTQAVFCKVCGMMLRLESASSKNECRFCHTVTDIKDMIAAGDLQTETRV
jgi:LSD1 subclass zinc finger protein